jgi:hypothetical protein
MKGGFGVTGYLDQWERIGRVETYSMCDVQVIRNEALEPGLPLVNGGGVFCAAKGNVCAAAFAVSTVLLRGNRRTTYAEKNLPLPVNTVMNTSSCSATSCIVRASL